MPGAAPSPSGAAQPGGPAVPPAAAGVPGLGLSGRRAVVTGGANGIGAACAARLARAGAHLIVADLNLDGAKTVAAEIGGQPWGVDLANPDFDAEGLAGEADILINCAG